MNIHIIMLDEHGFLKADFRYVSDTYTTYEVGKTHIVSNENIRYLCKLNRVSFMSPDYVFLTFVVDDE